MRSSGPIETRGIAGIPDLMHHKYVVRDGTPFDGIDQLTDDATRTGERHRTVRSPEIAYAFTLTFDQLGKGQVAHTGSDPARCRWTECLCAHGSA